MNDLRQQHGDHTWDICIEYYLCPHCKQIIEDRQKYENRNGLYQKDLLCHACGHNFTMTKKIKKRFAPLLGDPLEAS